jgi:hypothetical protein
MARETHSRSVRSTAAFIVVFGILALGGWSGSVEGRLPADFGARAMAHIKALVEIAPRPAGSPNELRAAEYVAGQFEAMGVSAVIEPFAFESFVPSRIDLKIGGVAFTPAGLGMDPYAPGLFYTGAWLILDPKAPSAWPAPADIEGKAVVTSEAGDPSLHFRIAALQPAYIIDLTPEDLDRVLRMKYRKFSLSIKGDLVKEASRNVVARVGSGLPALQIIVGAHLDAYRDNPGAGDNASGIAALLELARYFRGLEIPEGVGLTFVAFGAEEAGIVGSRQYVEQHADELKNCLFALVLDDLGGAGPVQVERDGGSKDAPLNPGVGVIPPSYRGRAWEGVRYPWKMLPPPALLAMLGTGYHPDWLTKGIDDVLRGLDFTVQFAGLQGSDQMSFAQAGIATTGVSAVSGRGHTQADMPETIAIEKVRQCAEVAARIVQKMWVKKTP